MFKVLGMALSIVYWVLYFGLFISELWGTVRPGIGNKIIYALFCLTGVWMLVAARGM